MPPKKKTQKKPQQKQEEMPFTLQQAIDYINSLANAPASKRNWTDALATLVHYNESKNPYPTELTKAEMAKTYAKVDISKLVKNFDKVVEIVEKEIKSSRDNKPIAIDTIKQYYLALVRVSQKGSPFKLTKELKDKYNDKVKEFGDLSNKNRNTNEPKRGNAENPDFDWLTAVNEYDKYISTHAFTKTVKGKKDLKIACAVGLYILQRPRRVADYATLQFYGKTPTEAQADGRNILYMDDDKMFVSIDKFKTRFRVSGASKEAKELLPRYVKELNPRLADLFKKYIKIFDIKDMNKLTAEEKRQKKEYFIFFLDTKTQEDGYDENAFSKFLTGAFKVVFNKRKGLSVNTLRHAFNTWISEHLQEFTDAQLQEIATDVGDTPKNLPTNLRYRIANQENKGMQKTDIEGMLYDDDYARNVMMADVGENASIGDVQQERLNIDDGEVVSPSPMNTANDTSLDELYKELGRALMEVERIKSIISKRLGY